MPHEQKKQGNILYTRVSCLHYCSKICPTTELNSNISPPESLRQTNSTKIHGAGRGSIF